MAQRWPGWRVKIDIPPFAIRQFTSRAAAEQHARYFAYRACAQAAGYSVHKATDGWFTFKRPDGTPQEPPHVTESGAWFAAYADSTIHK